MTEAEMVERFLAIFEVILVTYRKTFIFEIILPKVRPITVGIIYMPPKQTNFLEVFDKTFIKRP